MIKFIRNSCLPVFLWVILQFNCTDAVGQSTYALTYSNGTYSDLTGATSLNNGQLWDDHDTLIPIGFTFELFDQSFDSIHISVLVWFKIDGDYFIEAFFADFIDRGNGTGTSLSPKSFLLDGAPGDRILKIEWKNAGFLFEMINSGTLDDSVNVQLWLYEDSGYVEIRVGSNSVAKPLSSFNSNEGPRVGLRTYFGENLTASGAADAPVLDTTVEYLTGTPSDGMIYRFSRCVVPTANYSHSVDSAYNVSFTNSSINASNLTWEFGDDSTSTVENPSHIYLDTGFYSVKQYAHNYDCYTDSSVQIICIGFDADFSSTLVASQTVSFIGLSGDILSSTYAWDFGDGMTSSEQNPSHIFADTGSVEVTLVITNMCSRTYTKSVTMNTQETGIDGKDRTQIQGLTVFPNPVDEVVNISLFDFESSHAELIISDLLGRVVEHRNIIIPGGSVELSIDMSNYVKAVYNIQVRTHAITLNEKVFKQ
ncbi:MAG: PKD domain-containing protein [Flavobacteriales bacterium]|nr:PKD domain-containing protein [Flavobacteriales bacterium]